MAETDVVEYKLPTLLDDSEFDWTKDVEPMPFPGERGEPKEETDQVELGKPPLTNRVYELTSLGYRSVGRMMLVIGGTDLTATGWVVAPRAFITAGHCVYEKTYGGWITKASLCPRYDDACVKEYKVTTVYTLKGWYQSEDHRYDMAACVVSEKFAATEPPLAFSTGVSLKRRYAAAGYPAIRIAGYRFDGKRMWRSVGDAIDTVGGLQWAENNMTKGSSGGPWFDTGKNFAVSGITSHRDNDANAMASPLLINGFQNLYDAVKNIL
jgi:V8-like Glu-specific endopeptidase